MKSKSSQVGGGIWHWLMQDTMDGLRRRRALLGYLFLLPTLLGIFIFTAGPIFVSFGLSLFRWNIFKPPRLYRIGQFRAAAKRWKGHRRLGQHPEVLRSRGLQPSFYRIAFGFGGSIEYPRRGCAIISERLFSCRC